MNAWYINEAGEPYPYDGGAEQQRTEFPMDGHTAYATEAEALAATGMTRYVKLMLVTEDGEVLDSTDPITADEYNQARLHPSGAWALLHEMRQVPDA